MDKDTEIAELRARVEALEKNFQILAEVMSDGGGRLQAMQAAVHALIVTNPNGAAFGPSLQNALEVVEANTLATVANDVYLASMQSTKEACLGDLARMQAPNDAEQFAKELVIQLGGLWPSDGAKASA